MFTSWLQKGLQINIFPRVIAVLRKLRMSNDNQLTIGTIEITDTEKRYVNEAMDASRLTYGKFHRQFERDFSARHECAHGVFCNSGTSALLLVLSALRDRRGWNARSEVIVPSVTFIRTINAVLQSGLKPVFADVDPLTYSIDPKRVRATISKATVAIMPVHLFGLAADMTGIMAIAEEYGLDVVEDACESAGAEYQGRRVGSFGVASCFSTYAAHIVVTGVGGMVCTGEQWLADECRSRMAHGRDTAYLSIDDDDHLTDADFRDIVNRRFNFVRDGFSFRLTELEAAIGCAQMERLDSILARRAAVAGKLAAALKPFPVRLPWVPTDRKHAWMMFPIVCNAGVDRDALVMALESERIETRFLMPVVSQPWIIERCGDYRGKFPLADNLERSGFYIGCHQQVTDGQIEHVGKVFEKFFAGRMI